MPTGQPAPTRDEFLALAREHSVVPVWREVLADMDTPLSAFAKLVGERDGFLLESVEHAERWGRYSFLGWDPVATLTVRGQDVAIEGDPLPGVPRDRGALGAMDAMVAKYRAPALDALPPFHGGVVGYLGYDFVREIERLGAPPKDDHGFADAVLFLTASVAAFDHY